MGVVTTPSLKSVTVTFSVDTARPSRRRTICPVAGRVMPRKLTVMGGLCAVAVAAAAFSLVLSVWFPLASTKRAASKVVTGRTSTDHPSKTITMDATCSDWAAWIPSRSEPAVVMQVQHHGGAGR